MGKDLAITLPGIRPTMNIVHHGSRRYPKCRIWTNPVNANSSVMIGWDIGYLRTTEGYKDESAWYATAIGLF